MKIVMSGFYHESNTFSPLKTKREDFIVAKGDEVFEYFPGAADAFRRAGAEIAPGLFAGWISSGVIEEDAYRHFVAGIVEHILSAGKVDGVWLMLHGAIYVDNLGSGEQYLLRKIRKAVGYDVCIAVATDPHGNLSPDIVNYANIVRAYHTAPHTDQQDTYRVAAEALVDHIRRGVRVKPAFARLPMLLNGDSAVTRKEPLKTAIADLKALEARPEISTAAFLISMHSANTENTYPAAVVVPSAPEHYDFAMREARRIAHAVYDRRREFEFEAEMVAPEQAVEAALAAGEKPVVISDSGDNTTAGGTGMNTVMLDLFLKRGGLDGKKVLVSTIHDPKAYATLAAMDIGAPVDLMLGAGVDEHSRPVRIRGVVKSKGGTLLYLPIRANTKPVAGLVTVSLGDVDVTVTEVPDSFTDLDQAVAGNFDPRDYDVIVIKQAYQFPDIVALAKKQILALTGGATYQDLLAIRDAYTKIPWTIYPFEA